MADSQSIEKIECPIGKWYFKRMTMLGVLLLGFGGWFAYDGLVKYPREAFEAVANEAFTSSQKVSPNSDAGGAKEDRPMMTWDEYTKLADSRLSKSEITEAQLAEVKAAFEAGSKKPLWSDFAIKKKFEGKADPAPGAENYDLFTAFTAGGVEGAEWATFARENNLALDPLAGEQPDERAIEVMNAFTDGGKRREWGIYAAEKGWPSEPHFHAKGDIFEQLVIGLACGVAGLIVLIVMLLNRKRAVSADAEAYYPKASQRVAFSNVFKVDTRKWRRKGLAYAYYKSEGGDEKKAVLDDLKFAGSQAILDRMVANFEGELVEEVIEEDDELDDTESASSGEEERLQAGGEGAPDEGAGDDSGEVPKQV